MELRGIFYDYNDFSKLMSKSNQLKCSDYLRFTSDAYQ